MKHHYTAKRECVVVVVYVVVVFFVFKGTTRAKKNRTKERKKERKKTTKPKERSSVVSLVRVCCWFGQSECLKRGRPFPLHLYRVLLKIDLNRVLDGIQKKVCTFDCKNKTPYNTKLF